MRNPLKRLARRDRPKVPLPKVPLRERLAQAKDRLAATKEKYARTLRVHRALNDPLPAVKPAVDRAALVNYATFLWHERRAVCAELYPHKGTKAVQFVLGMNEAWAFFLEGCNGTAPRRGLAPASTRAVDVLDLVGIDWRRDRDTGGVTPDNDAGMRDSGERPVVPHNWPAPDAALLEALDDLVRLDAACQAIYGTGDASRDHDDVPGYDAINLERGRALLRLNCERAESLIGLQAKARAMLMPTVAELPSEHFADIAASLAHDLLKAPPRAIEPRPDPIFAVIEEAKRLEAAHQAVFAEPQRSGQSDTPDHIVRRGAACEAKWSFVRGTLLKTVPTTAEGCKALARFAHDFLTAQGSDWTDDAPHVLDLIARSPLL